MPQVRYLCVCVFTDHDDNAAVAFPTVPGDGDSPAHSKLNQTVQRLRVKLAKETKKIKVISSKVVKPRKDDVIAKVGQYLSGNQLRFVASQIRMAGRKAKGFRWTKQDKTFALQLYHSSPKCYRLLRKVFSLPSIKTLGLLLRQINMSPGFNPAILDSLKMKVSHMSEKAKLCCMFYDEMAIKEYVQYNKGNDSIDGLEDFGNNQKSPCIANHAGVFMVSGITDKWKQVVGYCVSSGPIKGKKIKKPNIRVHLKSQRHWAEGYCIGM